MVELEFVIRELAVECERDLNSLPQLIYQSELELC